MHYHSWIRETAILFLLVSPDTKLGNLFQWARISWDGTEFQLFFRSTHVYECSALRLPCFCLYLQNQSIYRSLSCLLDRPTYWNSQLNYYCYDRHSNLTALFSSSLITSSGKLADALTWFWTRVNWIYEISISFICLRSREMKIAFLSALTFLENMFLRQSIFDWSVIDICNWKKSPKIGFTWKGGIFQQVFF